MKNLGYYYLKTANYEVGQAWLQRALDLAKEIFNGKEEHVKYFLIFPMGLTNELGKEPY